MPSITVTYTEGPAACSHTVELPDDPTPQEIDYATLTALDNLLPSPTPLHPEDLSFLPKDNNDTLPDNSI